MSTQFERAFTAASGARAGLARIGDDLVLPDASHRQIADRLFELGYIANDPRPVYDAIGPGLFERASQVAAPVLRAVAELRTGAVTKAEPLDHALRGAQELSDLLRQHVGLS